MLIILDYGVGNLSSIRNMLKKAGVEAQISGDKAVIAAASKLLLPGMGHFDNCMEKFTGSGLQEIVEQKALKERVPLLGICVGLQMLMERSEEGQRPGLSWVKGDTLRFSAQKMDTALKIPNMGWLEVVAAKPSPLLEGLEDARFYFAHSFHVLPADGSATLLHAHYGYSFTAAIEQNNLLGVQFHPEKSHRFGLQLLKNFALNY